MTWTPLKSIQKTLMLLVFDKTTPVSVRLEVPLRLVQRGQSNRITKYVK